MVIEEQHQESEKTAQRVATNIYKSCLIEDLCIIQKALILNNEKTSCSIKNECEWI